MAHVDVAALQRLGGLHAEQGNERRCHAREPEVLQQLLHHLARATADRSRGDPEPAQRVEPLDRARVTVEEPQRLVGDRAERHQPVLVTRLGQPALRQADGDAALALAQPLEILERAGRRHQHQLDAGAGEDFAIAPCEGVISAALGAAAHDDPAGWSGTPTHRGQDHHEQHRGQHQRDTCQMVLSCQSERAGAFFIRGRWRLLRQ